MASSFSTAMDCLPIREARTFDASCFCAMLLLRPCLCFKYSSLVGKETTSGVGNDDVEWLVVDDDDAAAAAPVVCVGVDGDAAPRFDSLLVVFPKNEDTC